MVEIIAKADYGDASEDFLWDGLALTAFGEDLSLRCPPPPNFSTSASASFFTGKPEVAGLGHAFLFCNYRASLGKWQTADPLGYPDGWNQLAYCGNETVENGELLYVWKKKE